MNPLTPERESVLLRQCKYLLRVLAGEGLLVWRRIHVMPISMGRGLKHFRRNVDMAGMTDLIIWVKGGPTICAELKTSKGKLSDAQKEFESQILQVGHKHHVIKSVQQFDAMLRHYGVSHWALGSQG